MGTPDFAVPSLKALVEHPYEVAAVVTREDKPKDRGHELKAPPVKEFALTCHIPVFQPRRLSKEPEIIQALRELEPDLFVTCAFGQILSQEVLDIPRFGTVNVHGSLLPKYRGAAPIQRAVINGESKTGITTMLTDIGMDTGDMLLKKEIEIPIDMTAGQLYDIMSELGAETLINTIEALEQNKLQRTKQDDSLATYAPKIDKKTGHIDWNQPSRKIHDLIRGTSPWPGAYSELCSCRVKIWRSALEKYPDSDEGANIEDVRPGTVLKVDHEGMWVRTGDGALFISEMQADCCRRMSPGQYACGHELKEGMNFF